MKALYILDQREGGLVLYGHDLEDGLVETLVAEYQAQGKYAYSVDQVGLHGGPAEICEKCRRAGEKIASGTLVYAKPSPEQAELSPLDGAIGMVSEEVEASSRQLPSLGNPLRKLFNLLPIVAALLLVGYGLVYFMRPEAAINRDGQDLQPASILPLLSETQSPPVQTVTPSAVPTSIASATPSAQPTSTEAPVAVQQDTSTPAPVCVDALSVTADDAGQTLCVQGEVYRAEQKEGVFSITFSKDWGNFYLLSYDRVWNQAQPGVCIQVTGDIVLSGTIPVIVFGYRNELSLCP